jgi:hypothetical protein
MCSPCDGKIIDNPDKEFREKWLDRLISDEKKVP